MKTNLTDSQRLEWLDVVKAVGIILVYFGHAHVSGTKYIYMFHMPLFFVISGFCWKEERNRLLPFRDFVRKKFKAYIIPYFKVAIVCFFVLGIAKSYTLYGLEKGLFFQLSKYLFGIIVYSRGTIEWLPSCSPIWFLTCLFCAEIIFYWIMHVNRRYIILYVVLAGILGSLCSMVGKFFPWNVDSALSAVPLLYVGMIIKRYQQTLLSYKFMPIFAVLSVISFYNPIIVDFDGNYFQNQVLMYIYGVVISVFMFQIIKALIPPPTHTPPPPPHIITYLQ